MTSGCQLQKMPNYRSPTTGPVLNDWLQSSPIFSTAGFQSHNEAASAPIVRDDPDEDAVKLVEHLQRLFPREFETVRFPDDQDLNAIDLRPYFDDEEIKRQGSNMLRWVLLRISSMNGRRMHKIRRLGWLWKETHFSTFRDAPRFTAHFLREHGMQNDGDDELLESVANYLNGMRMYLSRRDATNGEQNKRYSTSSISFTDFKVSATADTFQGAMKKNSVAIGYHVHERIKDAKNKRGSKAHEEYGALSSNIPENKSFTTRMDWQTESSTKQHLRESLDNSFDTNQVQSEGQLSAQSTKGVSNPIPMENSVHEVEARQLKYERTADSSASTATTNGYNSNYSLNNDSSICQDLSKDAVSWQTLPAASLQTSSSYCQTTDNDRKAAPTCKAQPQSQNTSSTLGPQCFTYAGRSSQFVHNKRFCDQAIASGTPFTGQIVQMVVPSTNHTTIGLRPLPFSHGPAFVWAYPQGVYPRAPEDIGHRSKSRDPGTTLTEYHPQHLIRPDQFSRHSQNVPYKVFTDDARRTQCDAAQVSAHKTGGGGSRHFSKHYRSKSRRTTMSSDSTHSVSTHSVSTHSVPQKQEYGSTSSDSRKMPPINTRIAGDRSQQHEVEICGSASKPPYKSAMAVSLERGTFLTFHGWCNDPSLHPNSKQSSRENRPARAPQSKWKSSEPASTSPKKTLGETDCKLKDFTKLYIRTKVKDSEFVKRRMEEMPGYISVYWPPYSKQAHVCWFISNFQTEADATSALGLLRQLEKTGDSLVMSVDYAFIGSKTHNFACRQLEEDQGESKEASHHTSNSQFSDGGSLDSNECTTNQGLTEIPAKDSATLSPESAFEDVERGSYQMALVETNKAVPSMSTHRELTLLASNKLKIRHPKSSKEPSPDLGQRLVDVSDGLIEKTYTCAKALNSGQSDSHVNTKVLEKEDFCHDGSEAPEGQTKQEDSSHEAKSVNNTKEPQVQFRNKVRAPFECTNAPGNQINEVFAPPNSKGQTCWSQIQITKLGGCQKIAVEQPINDMGVPKWKMNPLTINTGKSNLEAYKHSLSDTRPIAAPANLKEAGEDKEPNFDDESFPTLAEASKMVNTKTKTKDLSRTANRDGIWHKKSDYGDQYPRKITASLSKYAKDWRRPIDSEQDVSDMYIHSNEAGKADNSDTSTFLDQTVLSRRCDSDSSPTSRDVKREQLSVADENVTAIDPVHEEVDHFQNDSSASTIPGAVALAEVGRTPNYMHIAQTMGPPTTTQIIETQNSNERESRHQVQKDFSKMQTENAGEPASFSAGKGIFHDKCASFTPQLLKTNPLRRETCSQLCTVATDSPFAEVQLSGNIRYQDNASAPPFDSEEHYNYAHTGSCNLDVTNRSTISPIFTHKKKKKKVLSQRYNEPSNVINRTQPIESTKDQGEGPECSLDALRGCWTECATSSEIDTSEDLENSEISNDTPSREDGKKTCLTDSPITPTRPKAQPRPGKGKRKKNKAKRRSANPVEPLEIPQVSEASQSSSEGLENPLSSPYSLKPSGIPENVGMVNRELCGAKRQNQESPTRLWLIKKKDDSEFDSKNTLEKILNKTIRAKTDDQDSEHKSMICRFKSLSEKDGPQSELPLSGETSSLMDRSKVYRSIDVLVGGSDSEADGELIHQSGITFYRRKGGSANVSKPGNANAKEETKVLEEQVRPQPHITRSQLPTLTVSEDPPLSSESRDVDSSSETVVGQTTPSSTPSPHGIKNGESQVAAIVNDSGEHDGDEFVKDSIG